MNQSSKKGFKILEGASNYSHFFGGKALNVPICPNCNEPMHLIVRFDMSDPIFAGINMNLSSLPLVSCLNCSSCWETQFFKLEQEQIKLLFQENKESWVADEEDKLVSPLPELPIKFIPLGEKEIFKSSLTDEERDLIFDCFGTEYIGRLFGGQVEDSDSEEKFCCSYCGEGMTHIASITEDMSDKTNLISAVDFLLGEIILNFFLCAKCKVIRTEPLLS